MKELNIYVCSHKDFKWDAINREPFTVLKSTELKENKYTNIEYAIAEIYHLYDIYTNKLSDSSYIGINQYRKIFDLDRYDVMTDIKNYDIILPSKLDFRKHNVYQQVLSCSSKKLFDDILKTTSDLYPEYKSDVDYVMNQNKFYAYNMFIMSSEKLAEYCKWLYSIIDEYRIRMNFSTYDDIYNYVDKNRSEFSIIDHHKNPYYASVKQSTRFIGGFAERLFNIYIHHNFHNIKEYDIIESGQTQTLNSNIHFITFANTDSTFNLTRILNEAKNSNAFESVIGYTENDFDEDYKKLCGDRFEKFKRGYGYWSWKSYIIKKRLKEIKDGEILIYADCGCTIHKENIKNLQLWIDKINETGMFSPGYMSDNLEIRWNKGDLVDFINKKYNVYFDLLKNDLTGQINASVIIIKKNKTSVEIINDWYDICNNHFELINDSRSKLPNNKRFKEHRHDQSALSLIYKVYRVPYIEYRGEYGNSNNLAFIQETKIKK